MSIELGDASGFGWFIIAIATIMSAGIIYTYRKRQAIKIKYVLAVVVMFVVGIKWLLDH